MLTDVFSSCSDAFSPSISESSTFFQFEHGCVPGCSLKQEPGAPSVHNTVASMAAAAPPGSGDCATAQSPAATDPVVAVGSDQPVPGGKRRARIQRPRIDIDDQIREANRVSDLLKKMGQAAKTLKKAQTKAKQRLVKKAARLSPQDLERIAVLKRVFGDGDDSTVDQAASSSSALPSTSPPPQQGVSAMHKTLKTMMKGMAGADDVVNGLGMRYSQHDKQNLALAEQGESLEEAIVGSMPPTAKAIKRLPSLRRLPSGVSETIGSHGPSCDESQSKDD